MSNKLKVSSAELVANARQNIEEIAAEDLFEMAHDPSVIIIDLRDIRERNREGYIEGSFHCPRGMVEFWVDPDSPYYKPIFGQPAKFVFHCASGWRSAITVETLGQMGFENAAHITGGFGSWVKAGGPVIRDATS